MTYAAAVFAGLTFVALVKTLKLIEKPPHVMAISTRAMRDLRDPALDDEAKEARMREHARALGGLFAAITAGTVLAVAVPLGFVWALDAGGLVSLAGVLDALSSWPVLLGGTAAVGAKLWLDKGSRP